MEVTIGCQRSRKLSEGTEDPCLQLLHSLCFCEAIVFPKRIRNPHILTAEPWKEQRPFPVEPAPERE